MTILNSTISGDSAQNDGGGLDNLGTAAVVNSTLSRAYSAQYGGGLSTFGPVTITNSTIVGNSAYQTGGIYNIGSNGSSVLKNTIVAGNTLADKVTPSDIGGTNLNTANSQFNLIGAGGSGGLANGVGGNQVGLTNLGLGKLASNGGPTPTIALLAGSPAIDAGSNALAVGPDGQAKPLINDQRGFARVFNNTVDIGSYESQGYSLQVTSGSSQTATVGKAFSTHLLVLVTSAGSPVPGATFTAPATGASGTFANGSNTIQVTANSQGLADAGVFTANTTTGTYNVSASASGANSTNFQFYNLAAPLAVTSVTPTSTGFTASFNEPFALAPLNLYGTATASLGPADVTLVGASTGPVRGSLIVSPGNQTITFVKTGGVLAPDTYTLTLRSAANGFQIPPAGCSTATATARPATITRRPSPSPPRRPGSSPSPTSPEAPASGQCPRHRSRSAP